MALLAKHLYPSLLAEELLKLKSDPEIYITHQPAEVNMTMQEISEYPHGFTPARLQNGQVCNSYRRRNNK